MKSYSLFKVHIPQQDALTHISDVFASGFINEGVQVGRLTTELQRVLQASNLILVNSCTSALTMALHLAGVGHGDDVVSTPMTCVATNTPIIARGANIIWADVDPQHGMLTPETVEAAITPRTRAVLAVAWAGNPPDMQNLAKVCDKHNVELIIDAAHAFGATYKGAQLHEWASYACYSFQAIKHFTTGDGGALICHDDETYRMSKSLKWFGLDRDRAKDDKGNWKGQQWDVDIVECGYKFNMNNVSAAIGLSQLPHVQRVLTAHKRNAATYNYLFKDFDAVQPILQVRDSESAHWVYSMKIDPIRCRLTRDELLHALNAQGIMAGVVHVPNDDYTCFKRFKKELPGVREFSNHQFSLPCGWWLDTEDIEHIARQVKALCA